MADLFENPIGTDGFDFVEYAAPDPAVLHELFTKLGFRPVAKHKRQSRTLYMQGDVKFIINEEPGSYAAKFAGLHGPCACAMAFRVKNVEKGFAEAKKRGAQVVDPGYASGEKAWPCVEGIGGSRLYLVDEYGPDFPLVADFEPFEAAGDYQGCDLTYLDHLTHNVYRGNMEKWADFYENVFNFREIRYFDIEGKLTGLISKAMTSPCGKIRIPINESQDDVSQIAEYLDEYEGEGIQHIALGTDNIYKSTDLLRSHSLEFQATPETYYEQLDGRVKDHGEDTAALKERDILLDGAPTEGQGILLQIFTKNVIGPIFFEIIQRKGNEGFGEGNFQALFDSIELDQVRRGVLQDK